MHASQTAHVVTAREQPQQHRRTIDVAAPAAAADGGLRTPIVAMRYRTRMCYHAAVSGTCEYQARCMFAHTAEELRTPAMNMRDGLVTEAAIRKLQRDQVAAARGSARRPGGAATCPENAIPAAAQRAKNGPKSTPKKPQGRPLPVGVSFALANDGSVVPNTPAGCAAGVSVGAMSPAITLGSVPSVDPFMRQFGHTTTVAAARGRGYSSSASSTCSGDMLPAALVLGVVGASVSGVSSAPSTPSVHADVASIVTHPCRLRSSQTAPCGSAGLRRAPLEGWAATSYAASPAADLASLNTNMPSATAPPPRRRVVPATAGATTPSPCLFPIAAALRELRDRRAAGNLATDSVQR